MRFKNLTVENQEALRTYTWPKNNDELRETAAWIAAIVRHGSVRKAAMALEMPRSTLNYWVDRLKRTLPLVRHEVAAEIRSMTLLYEPQPTE